MPKPRLKLRNGPLPADALVIEAHEDKGRWRVYSRAHGHLLFGGHTTRLPFLDAARELLKLGESPSRTLALVDADGRVCLAASLGYAAKWSVLESPAAGPRLIAWREHPGNLWVAETDGGDDKSP